MFKRTCAISRSTGAFRAASVRAPTTPSAIRPWRAWNRRTACRQLVVHLRSAELARRQVGRLHQTLPQRDRLGQGLARRQARGHVDLRAGQRAGGTVGSGPGRVPTRRQPPRSWTISSWSSASASGVAGCGRSIHCIAVEHRRCRDGVAAGASREIADRGARWRRSRRRYRRTGASRRPRERRPMPWLGRRRSPRAGVPAASRGAFRPRCCRSTAARSRARRRPRSRPGRRRGRPRRPARSRLVRWSRRRCPRRTGGQLGRRLIGACSTQSQVRTSGHVAAQL